MVREPTIDQSGLKTSIAGNKRDHGNDYAAVLSPARALLSRCYSADLSLFPGCFLPLLFQEKLS